MKSYPVMTIDRTTKHLHFTEGPNKPKTKTWYVVNKHDDIQLGWVGWFARWRKYAFFPKIKTVYEEDCLKDIAQFCIDKTVEHKQARKIKS